MRVALSLSLALALTAGGSVVAAQDLTGGAGTTSQTGGVGGGGESITSTAGPTDHSVVVGRLGLRYFGATTVRVLSPGGMGMGATATSTLHTVGARYWLASGLALEGGIALGLGSSSRQQRVQTGGMVTTTDTDDPGFFGIGLEVGLPLLLAESKHVNILMIPYLTLHHGRSAISQSTGMTSTDITATSTIFTLGARAAAEVQFGFIGAPQLSLQAQFGLGLQFRSDSTDSETQPGNIQMSESSSGLSLATTIGAYSLADIIGASVSATYYFGR